MSTPTALITADELLLMPDNGLRRELIRGELRESPLSGFEHGWVTMCFAGPLHQYVAEHDLGVVCTAETGFVLETNPDTVRAPDVAFVKLERLASIRKLSSFFPGPPDLAVEVISPSDSYSEVEEKVEAWLNAGCQMVILINPRNSTLKVFKSIADVTVLTVNDIFQGGELLPGFQLPVRQVFPVARP
ncbi:Uma2 family endonuclease [soil metagenome]